MSKRSEELAKQLYPDPKLEDYDDILVYRADRDNALMGRANVICVYEQAEKDLALTWEDIRTICLLTIGAEIVRDKPDLVDNVQEKLEQVFYEDVLRRFRETKNK